MRLLHSHRGGLWPQSRPRQRSHQGLRTEPLHLGKVMSPPGARPRDRRRRLNALTFDTCPPLVRDEPAAAYECVSDEHGRLGLSGATNRLNFVCVRGTVSQQLWPISVKGVIYSDLWVGDAEPY